MMNHCDVCGNDIDGPDEICWGCEFNDEDLSYLDDDDILDDDFDD